MARGREQVGTHGVERQQDDPRIGRRERRSAGRRGRRAVAPPVVGRVEEPGGDGGVPRELEHAAVLGLRTVDDALSGAVSVIQRGDSALRFHPLAAPTADEMR